MNALVTWLVSGTTKRLKCILFMMCPVTKDEKPGECSIKNILLESTFYSLFAILHRRLCKAIIVAKVFDVHKMDSGCQEAIRTVYAK